jgi:ParB/RepB/Spo0J family partition protein
MSRIVIGTRYASSLAELLTEAGFASQLIKDVTDKQNVVDQCNGTRSIVICASELPQGGIPVIRFLKERLSPDVKFYVVKDGDAKARPTKFDLESFNISEGECLAQPSVSPRGAFEWLKRHLNGKDTEKSAVVPAASAGQVRFGPTMQVPKGHSHPLGRDPKPWSASATLVVKEGPFPADPPRGKAASVVESTPKAPAKVGTALPPKAPQPKVEGAIRTPAPPAPSQTPKARSEPEPPSPQKQEDSVAALLLDIPVFTKVVRDFAHNDNLPAYPFRMDIVGKDGRTLYLDPRRCRDLPEQPRTEANPGFDPESLSELGESVEEFGQADQCLVCPIPGDPDFDAQIIDGARRKRSCLERGKMLLVTVTEKVKYTDYDSMFLMSVIRNFGKVPATKREQMRTAAVLRDRYQADPRRIALAMNVDEQTVGDLFKLLTLHPEVQAMLEDGVNEHEGRQSRSRRGVRHRLSAVIGLRLVRFTDPEEQLRLAREIVSKGMSGAQARRFLNQQGRVAGVKTTPGKHAYRFHALAEMTVASIDRFGAYLDMQPAEVALMRATRTTEERKALGAKLRELAEGHIVLAGWLEAEKGGGASS